MGAEAELLILPEMSMADLKQAMNRLEAAMKKAAKESGDEFEEELEKGIMAGVKRGLRKAGGLTKGAFGKMGGAGGIAGAAAGILTAGAFANIQRADEATALIEGRLGAEGSDARSLMGAADLIGLDPASIKKLWTMAQRAGFDDVKDFTDILTNINLKVTEAEIGEDPLLNQFKGQRGLDLYQSIFASLANAKPEEALRWMDKLEAGERLPEMAGFLRQIREGAGPDGVNARWLDLTEAEAQAGLDLLSEERKQQAFTDAMIKAQSDRKAAELAAITPDTIQAWMGEQQRITNEQVQLLQTYQSNLAAANEMRPRLFDLMTTIADNTSRLVSTTGKVADATKEAGVQGGLRAAYESSPTFGPKSGG